MALVTRVSRMFRADLHAVLDRLEEPDVLLRQAVREMEEELGRDQQRIKVMGHELEQLIARNSDLERSLDDIEEELDLCFESDKHDLARVLIKRKLEAERFAKHLCRKRQVLEESVARLNTRIEENRAQLESTRQKAELLSEDSPPDQPEESWASPTVSVRDQDVEVAFLREKQKRSGR